MENLNENKSVTVSAYSEDYSDKSYKFYFGKNQFEFIPKSQVNFIENKDGGNTFGSGIEPRYFEMPMWLVKKLQGVEFYTIF